MNLIFVLLLVLVLAGCETQAKKNQSIEQLSDADYQSFRECVLYSQTSQDWCLHWVMTFPARNPAPANECSCPPSPHPPGTGGDRP